MQKLLFSSTFFYGWVIVWATFLIAFLMSGAGNGIGVFVIPMSEEFGWNRTTISFAFFASVLASGISQPFIGRLCDKFGGRRVILVSLVVMGTCTILLSLTFHIVFLILMYGVVVSIVRTGGSLTTASWMLVRWFRRRRATVLAVAMAGSSLGGLVLIPLVAYILDLAGWRTGWVFLGAIVLLLALPLGFLLLRNDPKDMGLRPDGEREPEADRAGQQGGAPGAQEGLRGPLEVEYWRDAFGSFPMWQFTLAYFGCGFITSMLMLHFIPYAEEAGFSSSTAATAFGLITGLNFVGLLVTSMLSDRFGRKNVLASVYAMRVLGYSVLLLTPGTWGLWAFVVLLGFSWYASAPLTTSLTADIYGLKNLGVLNGVTFLGHQLGGALGVILAGVMYDVTGSYLIPFIISGALMAWSTLAVFSIKERQFSIKYQGVPVSTGG